MNRSVKHPAANVLFLFLVVAALYLAREFLIPLALAILVSFLLAPVVQGLERIHLGRVPSVVVSALAALLLVVGVGSLVGGQLIDLASKLPNYRTNLQTKIAAFKVPAHSAIGRAASTIKEMSEQIAAPAPDDKSAHQGSPLPVEVVNPSRDAFTSLKSIKEFAGPVLSPFGTAAIVLLFVIFILVQREDMRDRVIHLVGRSHLHVTTQALDEAAHRVSRYLLAQLAVNVCYGVLIGSGLYFIGLPNALLWGLLAGLFRFVPYVGPWIGAALPLMLSVAIFPGWTRLVATLGLFVGVELMCSNVLEPWLYGARAGISPIAVIVAAAFWAWLWGGIGLLLSTPLTVCLAVLGKYIPSLNFIDVLIGDHPPIAPEDRFYQRLLAGDDAEVTDIVERRIKEISLADTFDNLMVPTLRLAGADLRTGSLDDEEHAHVVRHMHELIAEAHEELSDSAGKIEEVAQSVVCIPARDLSDEAGCAMLASLLGQIGISAAVVPSKKLASEMIEDVGKTPVRQYCISAVAPASERQASYVCKRLRDRFPDARIIVGIWGGMDGDESRERRARLNQADVVLTKLTDAVKEIAGIAPMPPVPGGRQAPAAAAA